MIQHVDECLRALLSSGLDGTADGTGPDVSFDAPTPAWATSLAPPVLNLFLYDVREYTEARAADWQDVRDATGRVVGRRPPTRQYVLSYLVSAWAKTAEDEHRMLGEVLTAVPERETIPPEHLAGPLAEQQLAVPLRVAVPGAGAGVRGWELWSSLGQPPRASLELVVVAPLVTPLDRPVGPLTEQVSVRLARTTAT